MPPPPSAVPAVIATPTLLEGKLREIKGLAKAASGLMPSRKLSRETRTLLGDCLCVGTMRSLPVGPGVRAAFMKVDSAAVPIPARGPWLVAMVAAAQGGRGVEAVVAL